MILTPHLLVGAAIGAKIHNFWIIFILATVLHFLLDALPHWEYHLPDQNNEAAKKGFFLFLGKAAIDFTIGVFLIWYLLGDSVNLYYAIFGSFASLLPDGLIFLHILDELYFKFKIKFLRQFYLFHASLHIPGKKNPQLWGLALESCILILAIYLFF